MSLGIFQKKLQGILKNITGDIPKKSLGIFQKKDDHRESIKYLFSLFARSRRRRRMGREYDGKERGKWEGEVLTYLLGRLVFPFLDEPCVGAAV